MPLTGVTGFRLVSLVLLFKVLEGLERDGPILLGYSYSFFHTWRPVRESRRTLTFVTGSLIETVSDYGSSNCGRSGKANPGEDGRHTRTSSQVQSLSQKRSLCSGSRHGLGVAHRAVRSQSGLLQEWRRRQRYLVRRSRHGRPGDPPVICQQGKTCGTGRIVVLQAGLLSY